jgi:hypothetical protein
LHIAQDARYWPLAQISTVHSELVVSKSSGYSVCTTWYCFGDQYYLVDVWRHRRPSSELPRIVHEHAIKLRADRVMIELNNGSQALIETNAVGVLDTVESMANT